jgi:2-amino-4-hydroxy-6-hydroxymethyldihydropteridine diphosphokinase
MIKVKIKQIFLGIGSNLGNRQENLNIALRRVREKVGNVLISSSVYETEPWGFDTDNQFLNMVVKAETEIGPSALLEVLLGIEKSMGRTRDSEQYSSRIIDIDILFYDDLVVNTENLQIPHPNICERKFVLMPMAEIAPEFIHPELNRAVSYLLETCTDNRLVNKLHT